MAIKTPHKGRQTGKNKTTGLTDQQEQFCHAYLTGFNITKAEKAVGISKGTGNKWMSLPVIRERIQRIRIETGTAFDVTREALLQQLMNIVYADLRLTEEKDIVDWPDEEAAAVAGIEYNLMGDIKKITRWDKLKAIEILNKMLGYNAPDQTKNINVNTEPMKTEEVIDIAKKLKEALW